MGSRCANICVNDQTVSRYRFLDIWISGCLYLDIQMFQLDNVWTSCQCLWTFLGVSGQSDLSGHAILDVQTPIFWYQVIQSVYKYLYWGIQIPIFGVWIFEHMSRHLDTDLWVSGHLNSVLSSKPWVSSCINTYFGVWNPFCVFRHLDTCLDIQAVSRHLFLDVINYFLVSGHLFLNMWMFRPLYCCPNSILTFGQCLNTYLWVSGHTDTHFWVPGCLGWIMWMMSRYWENVWTLYYLWVSRHVDCVWTSTFWCPDFQILSGHPFLSVQMSGYPFLDIRISR